MKVPTPSRINTRFCDAFECFCLLLKCPQKHLDYTGYALKSVLASAFEILKKEYPMNLNFELALKKWQEQMELDGLAPRTIKEYPPMVRKCLEFVESEFQILTLPQIQYEHLHAYNIHLMENKVLRGVAPKYRVKTPVKPMATSTRALRVTQIRSFFQFLQNSGDIFKNPAKELQVPKVVKKLPTNCLEPKVVMKFLDELPTATPLEIRNKAILELMYSCALRVSEIADITLESLDLEERELRVIGKGKTECIIPVGETATTALQNYLYFVRKDLAVDECRSFFLTFTGKKLETPGVLYIINTEFKRAGLEQVSTKMFRHSCATHLLKNNCDIRFVQELLRHQNLSTTQAYTHLNINDLKENHSKYHPRGEHAND